MRALAERDNEQMADQFLIHNTASGDWLLVEQDRIAAVGKGSFPTVDNVSYIDAQRRHLMPGLIDVHVHGALGADTMDATPTAIQKMARFYGLPVDPENEVIVTHGATEAIFGTILGLVDPGDEVIVFEPYYDSYLPAVQIAGGIPRMYTLRPPDWTVDENRLAALFSDSTKLILINTPHNPSGKVFDEAELRLVADLCLKYDVIAVMDEVYEHIIFDGQPHVSMAALPGMTNRTNGYVTNPKRNTAKYQSSTPRAGYRL